MAVREKSISIDDAKKAYLSQMFEVKWRLRIVRDIINAEKAVTGAGRADLDLAHMQIRICIELFMFALAYGHVGVGYKLPKKTSEKEYHAKKIKIEIEKVNVKFFPVPVYLSSSNNGHHHFDRVDENLFYSKSELLSLYERYLGGQMHASREVSFPDVEPEERLKLQRIFSKFLHLVNWHYVQLRADRVFIFEMNFESDRDVNLIEGQSI